ncbi:MAG TPA: LysM peptidoglycan-binding domain-containing protein [Acidimicrobiales bacterium]|nr:LysM peptidoglycan-binding domain-containing protein [Acidimicrobiales bacterium]
MTALVQPLQLPTLAQRRSAGGRPVGDASAADRHRRAARAHDAAVYRRRRLAVLLALALVAILFDVAGRAVLAALDGGPLTAVEGTPSVGVAERAETVDLDVQPVASSSFVVRSGDTLWDIARRIQPTGDVRPLVDALAAARRGRPLQPGERIDVPRR